MKKFLYLLVALPLLWCLSACNDDDKDDMVRVTLSLDYSGASAEDGVLYVLQGETLDINALRAVPLEGSGDATITLVKYYWDNRPLGFSVDPPFGISIDTSNVKIGAHTLTVIANVAQVGKPLSEVAVNYPIVIVENTDEQPGVNPSSTVNTISVPAQVAN